MSDQFGSPPGDADSETGAKHASGVSVSQIVVGLGMIAALFVTSVVVGGLEPKKPAPAPATATAVAATDPAPAAPAAGDAPPADTKSQLEGLSTQLKGLQAMVEAMPKPEPAPDLAPLQGKVDELLKSVATGVQLSGKVGDLDQKIGGLDATLKALQDEVSGLKAEIKKHETAKPVLATPAAAADDPRSASAGGSPALADGALLFKGGKYQEAEGVFKKVEAANPQDARVFYYEALVKGLTTGDWKNDTLKIAAKGAALEKAGSTKPADVDAAFSDLPANLKPWLAFFRSQSN